MELLLFVICVSPLHFLKQDCNHPLLKIADIKSDSFTGQMYRCKLTIPLESSLPFLEMQTDSPKFLYVDLFHDSPDFLYPSTALLNSQLVYLLPVEILNHVMFHLHCIFQLFECNACKLDGLLVRQYRGKKAKHPDHYIIINLHFTIYRSINSLNVRNVDQETEQAC